MIPERENLFDQPGVTLEHDSQSDAAAVAESFLTLDTIDEEVKEGSVDDENKSITEDFKTSFANQDFSPPLDCAPKVKQENTLEPIRDKIKIQWMNEDDELENLEEQNQRINHKFHHKHKDIDGGWAWVVLIAVFCLFSLLSGLLASTSLYYQQMLKEFGHSRSYTAWCGSLLNAFFMLAGPLSSILIKRVGCRASIVIGSVTMTIGYLISSLAPSLEVLFFSYGVVVGMYVMSK